MVAAIQIHARDCLPSFSTAPSDVAVLFNWNLSRLPVLGQVTNLDLLQRCSQRSAQDLTADVAQGLAKLQSRIGRTVPGPKQFAPAEK